MTRKEFELMPRKPGWKYEYWDSQAHISPSYHVVTTSIEIKPRYVKSPYRIKAVNKKDESQLISAYLAAFSDTIEYCDWKPEKISASATNDIQTFFAGKRGNPHPSSRLATRTNAGEESVIGAALIVKNESEHPLLDILFVTPKWQRKGIATILVSSTINELYRLRIKTLESRYLLGNYASRSWHQKFGFTEKPDLFLTRLYYHQAKYEFWRREKIGNLTEVEREKLLMEVDRWRIQVKKLEITSKQEGIETV